MGRVELVKKVKNLSDEDLEIKATDEWPNEVILKLQERIKRLENKILENQFDKR